MSTTSKLDPNTLSWVKAEIDESLRQAHVALESFAENPSDHTRLRFCVTHLHQVLGTLQMVELDGAAMLAREAEGMADAILNEQAEANNANLELLSRAILLLPDYLGGLQFGRPDSPLKLLPLMNELRGARSMELISEEELFTPDLSIRPPPREGKTKLSGPEYAELAQKLRPAFQVALLNWLRDSDGNKALDTIASSVEELQVNSPIGVVEQLFWVASGLLEALQSGGLEPTNDRKKLVARLDQQIKKIIDGSEKGALRAGSEALTKSMLFQLGQAGSAGGRVAQLKRAFDLYALLGTAPDDRGLISELPEAKTVESVSTALNEEIKAAQELLAAYFDPDQDDVDSLEPLLGQLRKFSSTVDLLGIPELKTLVDQLYAVANAVVTGELEPNEEVSMRMAQALLLIENCSRDIWAPNWKKQIDDWTRALKGLLSGDVGDVPELQGIEVADVSETEFDELVSVVASEINTTLGKVEEAVEEFAANTSELSRLDEVPMHMAQIQGALQMLGEERALQLADVVSAHVDDLRLGKLPPTQAVLDALAVCVGTLTAYAEGLQHGRMNIDDLMDAAASDMGSAVRAAQLGEVDPSTLLDNVQTQLRRWFDDRSDVKALGAVQQGLDDAAMLAVSQGQERIERISSEVNALLAIVAEDPAQLSPEVSDTLKQSVEALVVLGKQHLRRGTAAEPAALDEPAAVAVGEGEFEESLIAEPPAEPDASPPATPEPLPVAEPLAGVELPEAAPAESVEQHDTAVPSQALEQASSVVEPPSVVELPEVPSAETVERQETVAPPQPPEQALPAPLTPATTSSETAVGADIDPELREIFIDEAKEVLENIGVHLPLWGNNPENAEALAEVRRGFHTLKGSGRMVGASAIGELSWAVEHLLNKVRERKIPHSAAIVELISAVTDVLPVMVAQLEGGPPPAADIAALEQRAQALASGEPVVDAPAPVAPTPPPAPVVSDETAPEPFPNLEHTLLQIFTTETRSLLETIGQEIASCREGGSRCLVTPALLRATHTLQGSARSIGLKPMSIGCGEMERFLEALQESGLSLEPTHLALLDEMISCVSELLDVLTDASRSGPELAKRFEDLAARLRAEMGSLAALEGATLPAPLPPEESAPATDEPVAEPEVTPIEAVAAEVPPVTPPLEPPAALADVASVGIDEDIDPELVDVFLDEAADLLASIEEALRQWRANPTRGQATEDLKRALHTLKGGARMASAMSVGNLAHNTEDLIRRTEDGALKADAGLFDLLDEVHDTLATLLDQIRQARPLSNIDALNAKIVRVLSAGPILVAESDAHEATPVETEFEDSESSLAVHADRRAQEEAEPVRERRDRRGQVRVRTRVLTDLVNYAGEVSIARARMEQQVHGLRENLNELTRNVTRFRDQIRELEIQSESQIFYRTEEMEESASASGFDPLELDRYSRLQQLSRTLTESLHDLTTIQGNLQTYAGEAETTLQQQARINANLQEGLMRTRMISFSTQGARLRHITRQTGRELGKRAELEITGTDVGVDRTVLERMMGPFEHMIRNALDHGIESEEERRRAGKPPTSKITVNTSQEGTEIVIRFSDDGRGLDIGAIRRRAVEQGLMAEDSDLSDDELIQFILVSGFSTARAVTHLSGRGVGMDVVENEVKQLGGSMAVQTAAGEGTTFTIRLPVTLSITQALLAHVGDQMFAVPLSAVTNIIELPPDKLNVSTGKTPLLNFEDRTYSFMHLGNRLGIRSEARNGGKVPLLLSKIGTRDVALQVDGLGGTREIVVKPLSPQLNEIKGFAGATILGDGTVLLILDVGGLWLTDQALQVEHVEQVAPQGEHPHRPVIMVVDDSLTVRKVTGRHLQKRGLDVLTAKDGIDAIEQLHDRVVDVMLIDIEMPRMDGYELTTRIRSEARLKGIPIIMITSRAGEKHRKRAFELGVNMYMSKPYQEEELFANIDTLLGEAKASKVVH